MSDKKEMPEGTRGGSKAGRINIRPPQILVDLRRVWDKPASEDKTPSHKRLRKLMDHNPKAFLAMLLSQEKELQSSKAKVQSTQERKKVHVSDDGTAKSLQQIERWIGEHGVKNGVQGPMAQAGSEGAARKPAFPAEAAQEVPGERGLPQ